LLAAALLAAGMTHAENMESMDMSSMQGGSPAADARSADYSEGATMSMMPGMAESMNDDATMATLLVDELEVVDVDDGLRLDAQGWAGRDAGRLWLKADGEHRDGSLQDLRLEALWARPWKAFWDTQLGLRHDSGEGPGRTWVALGVEGLAPYWFEIEATLYVGEAGRTAARFEVGYDLKLTQRLILTPDFEIDAYGKEDTGRRIGSGVSHVELGLRLRYEIRRQLAPYIGIDWNRLTGETADLVRADGEATHDHAIVAGVRMWF
jgi:copper resistance protein B